MNLKNPVVRRATRKILLFDQVENIYLLMTLFLDVWLRERRCEGGVGGGLGHGDVLMCACVHACVRVCVFSSHFAPALG